MDLTKIVCALVFSTLVLSCGGSLSTDATITSNIYVVSAGGTALETITSVPDRISKETFLAGLIKGDTGQTWDTTTISDPVVTGDMLVVTAADQITSVTYVVTVSGYALRDVGPAGGLIFYINTNFATDGWKYLEAAPVSEQIDKAWDDTLGAPPLVVTSPAVGEGQDNTDTIITDIGTNGKAAQYCDSLSVTNNEVVYDDWFLPSEYELELMYTNLHLQGVGSFSTTDFYWSSTDDNPDSACGVSDGAACMISFNNGDHSSNGKDNVYHVRAARAF